MRNSCRQVAFVLIASFISVIAFSQTSTISGNVKNSANNEMVPAVTVTLKGTPSGTYTDENGNFKLTTTRKPPFTLVFTSVGFESKEVVVNNTSDFVQVDFVPGST